MDARCLFVEEDVDDAVHEEVRRGILPATKRLEFSSPGYLDRQTLRGVRELDPGSAAELDWLLP